MTRRPSQSSTSGATQQEQVSRPTQYQRVLALLMRRDEVCSKTFYEAYIPRFSVWIHELRRRGYWVTKRPCDLADHHHEGHCWLYKIEALPESAL